MTATFLALLLAAPPSAAPKSIIPENQPPIANMFKPTAAEETPPGTGKFVLLTRTKIGKASEWDFMAEAWEFIPSKPDTPVTKRVEFCRSSWSPDTFVNAQHPRFLRLQVDQKSGYSVNLYDVNYRTWDAKCIWQGEQAVAFGVVGDMIHCRSGMTVNTRTAVVGKTHEFVPESVHGPYWLVRKGGDMTHQWTYNTTTRAFITRFKDVKDSKALHTEEWIAPDGKARVTLLASFKKKNDVDARLVIQRDGQDDLTVPVSFTAERGSGRPMLPHYAGLHFTPAGVAEFRSDAKTAKQWSIDLATGKVVEGKLTPLDAPMPNPADGYGPDYLKPLLPNFDHFGRGGLAPAFFMHQKLLTVAPQYSDGSCGVSADGRHVLYKPTKGDLTGELLYGDTVEKNVIRWKIPDALANATCDIIWVTTPE